MVTTLGDTLLHYAIQYEREKVVEVLLDTGFFDADTQTNNAKKMPLNIANDKKNEKIIHLITKYLK